MPFNPEKLAKLQAKSASVQTGGKGSVRRKKKTVRKNAIHDDKKLKSTLNKLNVRDIPAIEEVNFFKDDGTVIHFTNPKVQASIAANTYVISGNAENKKLQDLLPGIINQLGPDNLDDLKKIYASFSQNMAGAGNMPADDDDDVPELVDTNFEDASKKTSGAAGSGPSAPGGAKIEEEDDDVPALVES